MQQGHSGSQQRLARILDRAIQGDSDALQQLLTAYQGRLRVYVKRHFPLALAPLHGPEDIVQQALAQASTHIGTFQPNGDDGFHRWMVTIARREMAQALRRQRTAKRGAGRHAVLFTGPDRDQSIQVLLADLAAHDHTPSRSAAGHEAALILSQAMAELDEPTRNALHYRYFEHMTLGEAAQRMGRSDRAVNSLIFRGLQKLRESLASRSHYM